MSRSEPEDDLPTMTAPEIGPMTKSNRSQTFEPGVDIKIKRSFRNIVNEKGIGKYTNTYEYKDIKYSEEIRLLKIFRGKTNDPLKCMLFNRAMPSLDEKSLLSQERRDRYWALSYWWGDGKATNPIKIYHDTGGRGDTQTMTPLNLVGTFHVRDNLYAALRQCRNKDKDVNMWVDAICINQDQEDQREKTAQVANMDQIYSGAENVCVWLGAGTSDTKETFDFLKSLLNLQHLDDLLTKTKHDPKKWMLVLNLMRNRWFSRRWVIQELALARSACIRWGDQEIQWTNFAEAIALFITNHNTIKQLLGKSDKFATLPNQLAPGQLDPRALGANTLVNATSDLFRRSSDGKIHQKLLTLEVLVSSMFLAFEASNPEDTIFAVLSLAKDTFADRTALPTSTSWYKPAKGTIWLRPLKGFCWYLLFICSFLWYLILKPAEISGDCHPAIDSRVATNYAKSLTDIYADFMEYCVETSDSLDIICRHWAPPPKKLTPVEKLCKEKPGTNKSVAKEEEKLPSWIPSIKGHAFGGPAGPLMGRKHGDSFVGELGKNYRLQYNASGGLRPYVKFGKYAQATTPKEIFEESSQGQNETAAGENDGKPQYSDTEPRIPLPSLPRKFDGTLYIKGFKFAVITNRSDRVSHGIIPEEAFTYGGWNFDLDEQHEPGDRKTPNLVPDQLWRTLVADRGPHGESPPPWYRRACLECLQHVNSEGGMNTDQFKNFEDAPSAMVAYLERVQQVVWNRRFFLADGRGGQTLYGLCPPEAEVGDIICILFGCSVPVLLKKSKLREDHCTLVGECYVHEMMDGEAVTISPKFPYSGVTGFTLI